MCSSDLVVRPILAIDPIIDMGRTLLNVTGSMVNAIVVDRTLGQMHMDRFKDMSTEVVAESKKED